MKKIISLISGIILFFIISSGFSLHAASGTTYEVGVDELIVRQSAEANGNIVGSLSRGDKVTIFTEKYGWGQTYYGGEEAWVATQFLVNPTKAKASSQTQTTKKTTKVDKTTVTADGVRLRTGPSTNNKIIGFQNRGNQVEVIQTKGDWHEVKLAGGETAWIAAWLTDSGNQANVSTASSPMKAPASNGSLKGKNIVLDPGHGGYDPGSTAVNGVFEKQLTLDVAKSIGAALEARGATVIYTRSSDRYVSLYDRVRISNLYWTDAFISIHFNAFTNSSVNGVSTHYYGNQHNYQLAAAIQHELVGQTALHNRGVQLDNYYVLRENRDTSVLLELGFLTNQSDLNHIMSNNYRSQVGEAVANGLVNYFQ